MAEQAVKRSPQLEAILSRATPRHDPEVEEVQSLKESRPAMPSPMLDLVFRDGSTESLGYAYLKRVSFRPGDTLTLVYSTGETVVIEGRGLARHRQQIRQHRADEIRECAESELADETEGLSQVEKISIEEGNEYDAGDGEETYGRGADASEGLDRPGRERPGDAAQA